MKDIEFNLGKLRGKKPERNLIYYRRGGDEISINITNKCPNACPFCIRDHDKGWGVSNLYLEVEPNIQEIYSAFLEEFRDIKLKGGDLPKKVKICGYGEPILRIGILPRLVRKIVKSYPGLNWQLTTTGWPLLYFFENSAYRRMKFLYNSGVRNIYLSMHGVDYESYTKLVRPLLNQENAFEQTKEFAKIARSIGFNVTLSFINFKRTEMRDWEAKIKTLSKILQCEYHIRDYE